MHDAGDGHPNLPVPALLPRLAAAAAADAATAACNVS
jgi:hypothetical protein